MKNYFMHIADTDLHDFPDGNLYPAVPWEKHMDNDNQK